MDLDSCFAPSLCGAIAVCLTPDQVQPDASANVLLGRGVVTRFSQIVLPARDGLLSEVLVGVNCNSGFARLELQGVTDEGQPSGEVLHRSIPFLPDVGLIRLVIEPPLSVLAGSPFAIVLAGDPGCSASIVIGDPYPRGAAFIEDVGAPGEWVPYVADLHFETRLAQ
jgi:hypothetical protein